LVICFKPKLQLDPRRLRKNQVAALNAINHRRADFTASGDTCQKSLIGSFCDEIREWKVDTEMAYHDPHHSVDRVRHGKARIPLAVVQDHYGRLTVINQFSGSVVTRAVDEQTVRTAHRNFERVPDM
jgi:hypothetical protein